MIVEAIRGTSAEVLSLVAEREGALTAHVLFSKVVQSDSRAACALGPVAVDPPLQGGGIGDALIRAGIERLRRADWALLFVLGDPGYYRRFGFELAAPHGWHYTSHDFDRAFQVMWLVGPRTGAAGERWVEYDKAFRP